MPYYLVIEIEPRDDDPPEIKRTGQPRKIAKRLCSDDVGEAEAIRRFLEWEKTHSIQEEVGPLAPRVISYGLKHNDRIIEH